MLGILAAALLTQTTIKVPWPNVHWVSPLGKSGRYAIMTIDPVKRHVTVRTWPGKGEGIWFKSEWPTDDLVISPDGEYLTICSWQGACVYRVGSSKPVAKGYGAGLIMGKPASLNYDEKANYDYLLYEGKRIRPPAKRQFLMIAAQGDWIATDRVADSKAKGEDKYFMIVELWRLNSQRKLEFVRSLGRHWWDGGSTGVPSLLAIAGNGLAVLDHPSGGNALQFPVWVPRNGVPSQPFDKLQMRWTQLLSVPLPFEKGVVAPVWGVDKMAENYWRDRMQETTVMELGAPWMAWMDGHKVELWPMPVGFLNAWVVSPTEMGYAVRAKDGIEIQKMNMPPAGWWQPRGPMPSKGSN